MALGAWGSVEPMPRAVFVGAALVGCFVVAWAWQRTSPSLRTVLGVAILLRLLVLPLPPTVSDDGHRYVWDGWVQTDGVNPYAHRPSDPAFVERHETGLYDRLNSRDYYSVYPPASQAVFAFGGLFRGWGPAASWYAIKGLLAGFEVLALLLLARMVRPATLVLYAWHPLVVMEAAGQAHTEAGMVGFLVVAVWAAGRRGALAGGAMTVAGWFKLIPLVFLPFVLRRVGWRAAWAAAVVTAALVVPYAAPYVVPHVRESLDLYVGLFEWNAGSYFALKEGLRLLTGEDWSKVLGPALRIAFLLGLPVLLWLDWKRRWALPAALLVVYGWFLATTTTVHPWYLLGPLALVPLVADRGRAGALVAAAWQVLAAGSLGTYLFYTHGAAPYWAAVVLGWVGWATLLAAAGAVAGLPRLMRRRARRKWRWVAPYLDRPTTLLDLGAGEGFVGEAAAADGAAVTLADVVDFNRTDLPLVRYELAPVHVMGHRLPLPDDQFDATLLVFVLHHAEDPAAVLREARRVTHGRVAVVESVAETAWDRWWLPRADRLANRLRSGGAMAEQEEHLRFRSAADWRAWFEAAGFRVVSEERRGRWLHRQHLFVLEKAR